MEQKMGNSGTASAFQRGWDSASGKGKGKKNKQKPSAPVNASFPAPGAVAPAGGFQTYKNGGRVKKTGLALVHKGEYVVPAKGTRKASHKKTITKR
jgi:hypothetical protein